ncbi:MAG: acylphosphatase [Rhodospirillales bacterium]
MAVGGVVAVHAFICGRVQGVWYRAWTADRARELGLDGWVRNLSDGGTVEAVFSGPEQAVKAMLAACHEGPPLAQVTVVDVSPHTEPIGTGFEKWPTL